MDQQKFDLQIRNFGNIFVAKNSHILGQKEEDLAKETRSLVIKELRAMLDSTAMKGSFKEIL